MLNPQPFHLTIVVAMAARNRVIGLDGQMPWHVSGDLKHYRALTMGKPMIMGRKTLQSIGRILDGRDTIVLSRSDTPVMPGALQAQTPQQALELAKQCARSRSASEIIIAGGAEIYRIFLPVVSRIELTRIDVEPAGDAFFPELPDTEWKTDELTPMQRGPRDSAPAEFVTLTRRIPLVVE
ncbi:dihydrofolate reductase [Aureimonas fodinaquatilis]|uniref:Dihydrofolate reductase n=1 Tax=Aureimonas fodinaquatilis TaxID=2565783 RepID=A0A5B0E3B4_9HYPH|nr:dihydrofolate reductase [Aureimonas fodinaquatilis]KAA0972240.1 dihydrofolate reductase [Aureimonas fodinaquatilis]